MDPVPPEPGAPAGILATLRAFLGAGAVCGLPFGLADGIVAAAVGSSALSVLSLAGCLAAAVLQYGLAGMAALGAAGLVLHPFVRRKDVPGRHLAALRLGITVGVFAEIYWWTRPWVFFGLSALSIERLLAATGMLVAAAVVGMLVAAAVVRAPARVQRGAALLAAACWLGGAVFLALQAGAVGARGEPNARNRDLPNVLLVIVDALRRDVLGCYGNAHVRTPAIDGLASHGVLFENAFVQAPYTWTSFGSILTGKYPRRHGLVKMAPDVRMAPNVTLPLHLKTAVRRDGTRLEDGDWLTATFHTGTLTEASGLLQGFDLRFEATAGHGLVVLDSPWSVLRADLLLWVAWEKLVQRFVPSSTAHAAREFLDERGDRRFFAMVHLFSTHTPYDPPADLREQYCDPGYDGPISSFWAKHRQKIERGEYDPTAADVAQIRNLYFAGVAQADREIGELLEVLERRGVLDDTLVIVTADHGESLGERGPSGEVLWEHDHMVQTNLRVPLVMAWPKGLPAGARVEALVDEIDIFPTVCELLGIEQPPGADGSADERSRVDGASLVPLVSGERDEVRPFSFAENGFYLSVQDVRNKLVVRRETVRDEDGWREALAGRPERPRLQDLERDPEERFNALGREPEEAERLFAVLRDWSERMPIPVQDVMQSHRDLENQKHLFHQLGYTEGGIGQDEPQK